MSSQKSLLSCASSKLDLGLSLSLKIAHYAHKTSYCPENASIVNCVYKHLLTIKKKPASNIHFSRERESNRKEMLPALFPFFNSLSTIQLNSVLSYLIVLN